MRAKIHTHHTYILITPHSFSYYIPHTPSLTIHTVFTLQPNQGVSQQQLLAATRLTNFWIQSRFFLHDVSPNFPNFHSSTRVDSLPLANKLFNSILTPISFLIFHRVPNQPISYILSHFSFQRSLPYPIKQGFMQFSQLLNYKNYFIKPMIHAQQNFNPSIITPRKY